MSLNYNSLRRQRPLARTSDIIIEARGLPARVAGSRRKGKDGTGRVVYIFQQAIQHCWKSARCNEFMKKIIDSSAV